MYSAYICLTRVLMLRAEDTSRLTRKLSSGTKRQETHLMEKTDTIFPLLIFQHIPMFEHYNVLKQVKKSEKGAIPAFRIHKGEYYKIDETKCVPGSVLLEPPSIPDINTGEFEALKEKGDILGVYVATTIKTASWKVRRNRYRFHSIKRF